MTQFKVGDKVVRFRDPWGSGKIGVVGVVTDVLSSTEIRVSYTEGLVGASYKSCNFTLANTNKNSPHKHAEIIKLWAGGAQIQFQVQGCSSWTDIENPSWVPEHQYRVKPTPKPDTIQYIAVNDDYGVRRFNELDDARSYIISKKPEDFTLLKLTFSGETGKVKAREIVQ